MYRSTRIAHAALAWLFVGTVIIQVFLAGLGVFAGAENFRAHVEFGYSVVGTAALLVLLSALAARLPRRDVLVALGLLILYFVQTSLPEAARAGMPVVAALHPVNAVLIFALGVAIARRAQALARPQRDADVREGALAAYGGGPAGGPADARAEAGHDASPAGGRG